MVGKKFKRKCDECNTVFSFFKKDIVEEVIEENICAGISQNRIGTKKKCISRGFFGSSYVARAIVKFTTKYDVYNFRCKFVKCPICNTRNELDSVQEGLVRSYVESEIDDDYDDHYNEYGLRRSFW